MLSVAAGCLAVPAEAGAGSFDPLLERSNRQAMRDWYPGWRLRELGTAEVDVRPAASHALALAVSGRKAQAAAAAEVIDRVARAAPRWGGQWQSPLWAAELGLAALVMGDDLQRATGRGVRAAVRAEAERLLGYEVPYHRRHGVVLTPGDSKAEENGWRAKVLGVAAALMPDHPRRAAWLRKRRELVVSALARPGDTRGRHRRLLAGGSNVNSDYTVTNHGVRAHPDYAAAVLGETGFHVLLAALTRSPAPCAALLNHRGLYRRLTASYAPDGRIRRDFYDPLVADRPPFAFALADLQARVLGYGGRAAARRQRRHLAATLAPARPWPAPYGEDWNRGLLASTAAHGVLLERLSGGLRSTSRASARTSPRRLAGRCPGPT